MYVRRSRIPGESQWGPQPPSLKDLWSTSKRSEIGTKNRSKNHVAHYSGTKSHARIRATQEAKGNKIDKLETWLLTHEPKKDSKLDDASAKRKELILKELACMKDVQIGAPTRDELFERVVGEDKHGYAKTFGMGVRVSRSSSKRCALKEEKAKRVKIEQKYEETQERLQALEDLVQLLLKKQDSTSNHLTVDGKATAEKNQDEDRYNEDENNEVEDVGTEDEL